MNLIRQADFYDLAAQQEAAPLAWLPVLISLLRRSWRTIALWTLGSLAVGLAYVMWATPQFTAVTQLLIDPRQGNAFQQQAATSLDSMADSAIVESQVEVLRSDGTARHVVVQLGLAGAPGLVSSGGSWFAAVAGLLQPHSRRVATADDDISLATERLQAMASVRRIGLSNVIEVSVRSPDPAQSARWANALTAAYIDDTLQAKYDITRQAGAWLQDRLKELRDQSTSADRALEEQKARIGIVDTDKGGMNEQALGDLTLQLGNARARTADTAARYSRIQAITAPGLTASGSVVDALANTIILKLQQQYLDDARRLTEWTLKYGAQHVAVTALRLEMAGLQASLGNELRRIQETYQSDYDVARGNEAALQKQVDGLVAVSTATNGARAQMRALESLAETYRKLYGSFLQRYTEAAQDQSFPISQARTISAATPPLRRSAPAGKLVMLSALVAGLGAGFAASVFHEVTDRRFHTVAQVRAVTGLDCIAVLPRLRTNGSRRARPLAADMAGDRLISGQPALLRAALDQPQSPFAGAVRSVRARVIGQSGRRRTIRVIGIVSAAAGEGRTTLAANLAQMLAEAGHATVLVDGDTYNPQLTRWLAPGSGRNIAHDALAGMLWRDPRTALAFVPALSPAATQQAPALLAALQSQFDFIVVDLPTLPASSQAPAMAALMDGFIVVLAWAQTQQQTLIQALEAADVDSGRLLGVVFNKAELAALRRFSPEPNQHYRPSPSSADAA